MLAILASVLSAQACTYDSPSTLALDPSSPDETAPAPPEIVGVNVRRGRGGDGKACEDLGSITITVARPANDPDSEDQVGYRLQVIDGQLPEGLEFGSAPLLGPNVGVIWTDSAPPHGAFEVTVAMVPIDVAGNEGVPVEVTLGDAGGCGCQSGAGGAPTWAWAWAWGSLLVAVISRYRVREQCRPAGAFADRPGSTALWRAG